MGSAIEPFTLVNRDAHRGAHVPNKSAANKYEIRLSKVVCPSFVWLYVWLYVWLERSMIKPHPPKLISCL